MPYRTGAQRLEARRARLERHASETDPAVVLNAAARFLELRSRSVDEVRRHLSAAAFAPQFVDVAIERLLALGVLDDRSFATAWVESRDRARPRGEQALRRELTLKGIDRETIAEVLAARGEVLDADGGEAGSRGADVLAAEKLLGKNRTALLRVDDPRTRRGRAYALLARNGFDPDVCREVSARFVGSGPDTEADI